MTRPSDKRVKEEMDYLCKVARPVMLKYWAKNSCIASTRLAVEYLRGKGIRADALAVEVLAFSPAMARRVEEHGGVPDEETFEEWCREDEKVWSIGLGVPHPALEEEGFVGHVVCMVENKWLLDLSIDQASRPERDMPLEPLYALASENILAGKPSVLRHPSGITLEYGPRPEDRSFLTAPDWTKKERFKKVLAELD